MENCVTTWDLIQSITKLGKRVSELETKVGIVDSGKDWKVEILKVISSINTKNQLALMKKLYFETAKMSCVDIDKRLIDKRDEAKTQGSPYSKITKIDVIADDIYLRRYFEKAFEECQVTYATKR